MSIEAQQELKEKYYSEATRYIDNAKEYLKNAQKEDNIYQDTKYVRTACGTACEVFPFHVLFILPLFKSSALTY